MNQSNRPTYLTEKDIDVLKELELYIRKQQPAELEQFKQSIEAEGIRDALILTELNGKKILVDGHHRFKVGKELGVKEFATLELQFDSIEDIKVWMLKNQLGRRNATDAERIDLAIKLTEFISEKAKSNQKAGVKLNLAKGEKPINTNAEIAKIAKVSRANVTKFNKLQKERSLEEMQRVINGEVSIHRAYEDLRREIHQREIDRLKKKLDRSPTPEREKQITQLTVPFLESVTFILSLYIKDSINNYRVPKERMKDIEFALMLLNNPKLLKDHTYWERVDFIKSKIATVIYNDQPEQNFEGYERKYLDIDMDLFEDRCEAFWMKYTDLKTFKAKLNRQRKKELEEAKKQKEENNEDLNRKEI
ncbi:ParB N-terminal domain-containing protein (plasmid) [Flammeovirga sp. MY04]|uniref:ParB/RepB/Spo0J family partition protein n=1 Tax=Flammeovirga sp. MY04 TaxID=1191459 RepID=UPI00080631D6|nr:ParB/RepB/Spo0J family partition protein [Flammeovirga sp. MY04]ANQ52922.1 ParB N-terminal domain-containing protein [Flammeovirga sp. MY04]